MGYFLARTLQHVSRFLFFRLLDVKEGDMKELPLSSVSTTVQGFLEGATLGEFHTRLAMLLAFHCHVLLAPKQEGHGEKGHGTSFLIIPHKWLKRCGEVHRSLYALH